ncbi:MAG: hypothetical protein R2838_14950 [Caldilineaceae bacterium]
MDRSEVGHTGGRRRGRFPDAPTVRGRRHVDAAALRRTGDGPR